MPLALATALSLPAEAGRQAGPFTPPGTDFIVLEDSSGDLALESGSLFLLEP